MELRDYLQIINRSKGLIALITLLITAAVIGWSVAQPVKYESSATIVVNKPNPVSQRDVAFYQYDKYYSIQAASLYADTLAAWLSSPGTAKEIYEKAGLPVPDVNLKKLSRIFKPRRLPPVSLSIAVKDQDRTKAEKLVNASIAILDERTQEQNKGDNADHHFNLIGGATVTAPARPDLAVNTIIGLIGGLLLSLIIVFLRHYLKEANR